MEYYADEIAAFEGFTAGNYMFRQGKTRPQNWANSYDFPRLNNGTVIREEIPQGVIASGQSFVFNLRREKFQDPRVREAIALMFNFEWTNQTLFFRALPADRQFLGEHALEAEGIVPSDELAVLEPLPRAHSRRGLHRSALREPGVGSPTGPSTGGQAASGHGASGRGGLGAGR